MWTPKTGNNIQVYLYETGSGNPVTDRRLDPKKSYTLLVNVGNAAPPGLAYYFQVMTDDQFKNDEEDAYEFRSDAAQKPDELHQLKYEFKPGAKWKEVRLAFVQKYPASWSIEQKRNAVGYGAGILYEVAG